MTKDERASVTIGIFFGAVICVTIFGILGGLNLYFNPKYRYTLDYLLNSPDWYIDTTYTINKQDTIVTYKFKQVKE